MRCKGKLYQHEEGKICTCVTRSTRGIEPRLLLSLLDLLHVHTSARCTSLPPLQLLSPSQLPHLLRSSHSSISSRPSPHTHGRCNLVIATAEHWQRLGSPWPRPPSSRNGRKSEAASISTTPIAPSSALMWTNCESNCASAAIPSLVLRSTPLRSLFCCFPASTPAARHAVGRGMLSLLWPFLGGPAQLLPCNRRCPLRPTASGHGEQCSR
jgi:hypothetical protein